jgi:hypothetical protein
MMTDSEFWDEMATHLENLGCMPAMEFSTKKQNYYENDSRPLCGGLCDIIYAAGNADVVSWEQEKRLCEQMKMVRPNLFFDVAYYWRPGAVAPRVEAMRKLAHIMRSKV